MSEAIQGAQSHADGDAVKLDWKTRATVAAGSMLIRLLARTWRVHSVGREHFEGERRVGQPVIFLFWHGHMLPLVAEHRRPSYMLVSAHRDGEIIAQILHRFGVRTVRGSSSRGAARALLQLSRTLKDGHDVGITPDGPRGPRHSFAAGPLVLAQRTGAAIILLACFADRAWRLDTWDRFEIPKPFARVTVVYDEPVYFESGGARPSADDAERMAARLTALAERVASGAYKTSLP